MDINNNCMVVGLGSRARQGKGTVASTIYEAYKDKYDILVTGFGDALKEELNGHDQFELCMKLGVEYDFNAPTNDPLCNTKHGKQSKLLQRWGELRRQADDFYWVKKVRDKLISVKPQVAIIHDLRYLNEFYFVKSCGGYCVKVSRRGFVDLSRDPNHISETNLDNIQFDVDINVLDGELEQLKRDAITVFELLVAQENKVIPELEGVAEAKPMVVLA